MSNLLELDCSTIAYGFAFSRSQSKGAVHIHVICHSYWAFVVALEFEPCTIYN